MWQGPNGSSVTLDLTPGFVAAGSEFIFTGAPGAVALLRGPTHFSPDGEHCCVRTNTDPNLMRCVTFSEC